MRDRFKTLVKMDVLCHFVTTPGSGSSGSQNAQLIT